MELEDKKLRELAKAILATKPQEIGCDDWLALVAGYVELIAEGKPIPVELKPVEDHVALCPECKEELDLLQAAL